MRTNCGGNRRSSNELMDESCTAPIPLRFGVEARPPPQRGELWIHILRRCGGVSTHRRRSTHTPTRGCSFLGAQCLYVCIGCIRVRTTTLCVIYIYAVCCYSGIDLPIGVIYVMWARWVLIFFSFPGDTIGRSCVKIASWLVICLSKESFVTSENCLFV